MGIYDQKPGGRLKLKGDKSKVTKSKTKKKKKDPMSLPSAQDIAKSPHDTEHALESISKSQSGPTSAIPVPDQPKRLDTAKIAASTSPVETTRSPKSPYQTDAQKKFEDAKKQKMLDNMTKQKPFKERVQDYNEHLSKLSDQNEMPKISG